MQKVLSQIALGAVKISFGELRLAASPGTFSPENDRDRTAVELPLQEILARLNPALLSRRPTQRRVEVPPEVTGPFGSQCSVTFSTDTLKTGPVSQEPARGHSAPVPAAQTPVAPVLPASRAPVSANPASKPVARIRNASPSGSPPGLQAPVSRLEPPAPSSPSPRVYTPISPDPEPLLSAPPAKIQMPEAFLNGRPGRPITPIAPAVAPEPEPIRFNGTPPAVQPQPVTSGETRFLKVALADLLPFWPEALRIEMAQFNPPALVIALPFGLTEAAMKQGKVVFPWKLIRSWIQPPLPVPVSPHDSMVLELPLKVVAPLFLAELTAARSQKKITIDETIPNLFSALLPADAAARAPAASLAPLASPPAGGNGCDTNFYSRRENERLEETVPALNKNGAPGTAFLNRYATPNDIVNKAAALAGVDGALIALPDGLLVASRIPPAMNAETIAAFLPQIFNRVSQCTRELRLGDLNNLNFTVGNIPWKIFRVGAIYFAAFGRAGGAVPDRPVGRHGGGIGPQGKVI